MVSNRTSNLFLLLLVTASVGCAEQANTDQPTQREVTTVPAEQQSSPVSGNLTSETPWWVLPTEDDLQPEPIRHTAPTERFEISGDVLFAIDSAVLGRAADSQLNHILRLLSDHPDTQVSIVGHTDNTSGATPDHNQVLSEARATSVARLLVEQGVDPKRITTAGKADTEPVASNDTEAGRSANRRVVITFNGIGGRP